MKTQIQAVLIAVLFTLTVGCSSPYSAAQVSDLSPPAVSSDPGPPAVSETPEAILLRVCVEDISPTVKEVIALANQLEPEIERLERSERFSPGFFREELSCQDDAVRLMNSFSNCDLWALSNNMATVINLYGEARAAKLVCKSELEALRDSP